MSLTAVLFDKKHKTLAKTINGSTSPKIDTVLPIYNRNLRNKMDVADPEKASFNCHNREKPNHDSFFVIANWRATCRKLQLYTPSLQDWS